MRKYLVLALLASVAACSGGGGGSSPGSVGVSQQPGTQSSSSQQSSSSTSSQQSSSSQTSTAPAQAEQFSTSGGTGTATDSYYTFNTGTDSDSGITTAGKDTVTVKPGSDGGPGTLTFNFTDTDGKALPIDGQKFDISNAANQSGAVTPYGNGYAVQATGSNGETYTVDYAGASEPTMLNGAPNKTSLSYTTFGMWSQDNHDQAQSGAFGVFAAGQETPATGSNGMPTTGTATYTGNAMGQAVQNGNVLQIFGQPTLTADFGKGSITGVMPMQSGDPIGSKDSVPFDTINFNNGVIKAGTPTFAGNTAGTGGTGTFAGQFNGSGATELGATGDLNGPGLTARFALGASCGTSCAPAPH